MDYVYSTGGDAVGTDDILTSMSFPVLKSFVNFVYEYP